MKWTLLIQKKIWQSEPKAKLTYPNSSAYLNVPKLTKDNQLNQGV